MIKQSLIEGYSALDNCYKYTDSDSTIDCYAFMRSALSEQLKATDEVLNTNLVYALVGQQDNKTMVYIGKASIAVKTFTRFFQHIGTQASKKEKYYDYWKLALIFVCKNTDPADQWTTDTIDDLEALLIKDTQAEYSWNSHNERVRNPLTPDRIRSHSRKLLDIKEYVNYLGFKFFDKVKQTEGSKVETYEDKLNTEQKQLIDNTVNLKTINLEPTASVPEYTTPESVVNQILDLLPWEEFNEATKFLDPACKGGEFLALIHDRMMKRLYEIGYRSGLAEPERMIRVHEHIVNKQLFGIAVGTNSYKIAKERAYSCPNIIEASNDYIAKLMQETVARISNKKKINELEKDIEMKYDVIIGNPPYNDTDETGSSKSINTLFVDTGIALGAKYITYIMPDRWFLSPDKLNAHCRESLVGKIKYLRDFNDNEIPFEGVSIAGGVSYFLYDRDYDGEMKYVDSTGEVNVRHNSKLMCKSCKGNMLYNNVKNIATRYMDAKWISTSFFGLTRSARGHITKTDENNITLKSSGNDTYISLNDIPRNGQYAQYYKVAIPYSAMEPEPFILMPNEICTLTYLIIGIFKTIEEAQSCEKYFRTNFVKILFSAVKTKLGTTKENLMCIPIQDFKPINLQTCPENEKIDWSQSIENIDKQLYKKYKLTEDEITYIEKEVRPVTKSTPSSKPKQSSKPKPSKLQVTNEDIIANYINNQIKEGEQNV